MASTQTRSRLIAMSVAGIAVATSLAVISSQQPHYSAQKNEKGIPMPFVLQARSPLLGSITTLGYKNDIIVRDIAFDLDEIFEIVKGAIHSLIPYARG